jgi:hypothetical protein
VSKDIEEEQTKENQKQQEKIPSSMPLASVLVLCFALPMVGIYVFVFLSFLGEILSPSQVQPSIQYQPGYVIPRQQQSLPPDLRMPGYQGGVTCSQGLDDISGQMVTKCVPN